MRIYLASLDDDENAFPCLVRAETPMDAAEMFLGNFSAWAAENDSSFRVPVAKDKVEVFPTRVDPGESPSETDKKNIFLIGDIIPRRPSVMTSHEAGSGEDVPLFMLSYTLEGDWDYIDFVVAQDAGKAVADFRKTRIFPEGLVYLVPPPGGTRRDRRSRKILRDRTKPRSWKPVLKKKERS